MATDVQKVVKALQREPGLTLTEMRNKCGVSMWAARQAREVFKYLPRGDSAVQSALDSARQRDTIAALKRQTKAMTKEIEGLQRRTALESAISTLEAPVYEIAARSSGRTGSQSTFVFMMSDMHVEETIDPATVNGVNAHNTAIAEARFTQAFRRAARLLQKERQDSIIDDMVLWLGGDFITGYIHDELEEGNGLSPTQAMLMAQGLITSGIKYLLDVCGLKRILVPCSCGNHGRTTKERRVATEAQNSFEWLMYKQLEFMFKDDKRVIFQVSTSYHTYVDVYGVTLRFHHGHAIRYSGGVGGMFVPVHRNIAKWQRIRKADIDCFGHYHQLIWGGPFIANGSGIGYGPYALMIGAAPERPQLAAFLVEKTRKLTIQCPVILDGFEHLWKA